uniref:Retrotransposon gag domain-containing protein n=1 Tax=Amphimedon queenslandica TaxID=400682 RepID=A0A1X7TEW5_AMPQE
MMRRQQTNKSVDIFAHDFERLFEHSYGRRQGMDESLCEMLKRNLFIQGLLLQWQEKVLPSAETFADALYQARRMEEQAKQLVKMHPFGVGQCNNLTTPSKKPQEFNPSSQH